MWGGVCVSSLFPSSGPVFRDEVLANPEFQVTLKLFDSYCSFMRDGMKPKWKNLRVKGETWHFGY